MTRRSLSWGQRGELLVADYKRFQCLDGEGLRCSLYVSYCPFNCLGCYNKAAQKADYGQPLGEELVGQLLDDLARPHIAGLTLVGGEPMLSAAGLLPLVACLRREIPGLNIWAYTGYTLETLLLLPGEDPRVRLLGEVDVLVDGPFIAELRRPHAQSAFVGSSNQRILDASASLRLGRAVEYLT